MLEARSNAYIEGLEEQPCGDTHGLEKVANERTAGFYGLAT